MTEANSSEDKAEEIIEEVSQPNTDSAEPDQVIVGVDSTPITLQPSNQIPSLGSSSEWLNANTTRALYDAAHMLLTNVEKLSTNVTEDIKRQNADIATNKKELKEKVSDLNNLMFVVILVLLIGFATLLYALGGMLVDAYKSRNNSYESLNNQIMEQNLRFNELSNELNEKNVNNNTIPQQVILEAKHKH